MIGRSRSPSEEPDGVDIRFRIGDGTVGRVQLTIGGLTKMAVVIPARPFSAEEASRLKCDADLTL